MAETGLFDIRRTGSGEFDVGGHIVGIDFMMHLLEELSMVQTDIIANISKDLDAKKIVKRRIEK
jgi:hypothetical protein